MQYSCSLKLQTPFILQRSVSTLNFPNTRHLPMIFGPSMSDSSSTHPKYLEFETCSSHIPLTNTSNTDPSSPFNTIVFLLSALTFRDLLLYSFHLAKPAYLHTRAQGISNLSPPLKISLQHDPIPFPFLSLH